MIICTQCARCASQAIEQPGSKCAASICRRRAIEQPFICNCVSQQAAFVAGSKQSCPHVNAWPGAEPGMSGEAFEQHMKQFIDPDTGERKLTCISRARIPEDLRHGDLATEWAGVPLCVNARGSSALASSNSILHMRLLIALMSRAASQTGSSGLVILPLSFCLCIAVPAIMRGCAFAPMKVIACSGSTALFFVAL